MPCLPPEIMTVMHPFMQVVSSRIWDLVQVLLMGAILAPGKRTVTSALQVMGMKDEKQFQNYHRVLNRAKWSGLAASHILLRLLVQAFMSGEEALIIGTDETMERRWGANIKAKSIFRDGKRSSHNYTNYTPALRWVSTMLLVTLPGRLQAWALPFLTVLAPSKKSNEANGWRHKTSIDWIGQMAAAVRRWWPQRPIVLVTDGGLSGVKLGLNCRRHGVTLVTRLRWDAVLHAPAEPKPRGKPGPQASKGPRLPGLKQLLLSPQTVWQRCEVNWYGGVKRTMELASATALWYTPRRTPLPIRWVLVRDPLGELAPASFMASDPLLAPLQIVHWFILRWRLEVTFEEARAHLGLETQRQWSDLAIARTTPALLGLFSLVTLLAHHLTKLTASPSLPIRTTAWYRKSDATFADALAFVRRHLWTNVKLVNSRSSTRLVQIPDSMLLGLVDTLCYSI